MSLGIGIGIGIGGAAMGGAVAAVTLSLKPTAVDGIDTWVTSSSADSNFGTTTSLGVRNVRNALLKFSGISVIPLDATIVSAKFSIFGLGIQSANMTVSIARILAANSVWTETGATWNYAVDGVTRWAGDAAGDGGSDAGCSVIGTDFSSTLMGSFAVSVDDPDATKYEASLDTDEVAAMIAANAGLTLRTPNATGAIFYSSDFVDEPYQPELEIVYRP